jgi:hypothetical protein
MGFATASDSLAAALGPIVLSNVRTGLDADAIALYNGLRRGSTAGTRPIAPEQTRA